MESETYVMVGEVTLKVLFAMYTIYDEVYTMLKYFNDLKKYKKDRKNWRKSAIQALNLVNKELEEKNLKPFDLEKFEDEENFTEVDNDLYNAIKNHSSMFGHKECPIETPPFI